MKRETDKTGKRLVLLAGVIAIVAGCLTAYMPAILQGGFIWDDDLYVTNNPLLTAPDGLRHAQTTSFFPVSAMRSLNNHIVLESGNWPGKPRKDIKEMRSAICLSTSKSLKPYHC